MKINTLRFGRAASALLLGLLMGMAMPKMNAQTAHVGDILCEGDLVVSPANYPSSGATAKAVVFYVDNTGQHGWAIALQDAGSFQWGRSGGNTPLTDYYSYGASCIRQAIYDLDGYHNTLIVRNHNTNHPAFYAINFENGWYVPAIGQLNYLYGNLKEVETSLSIAGGATIDSGEWKYWSSTEWDAYNAWTLSSTGFLDGKDNNNYGFYNGYKDNSWRVRAAINF